jgi:hypothetical protein
MSTSSATLGVVMLCHTALERAAQVARFWLDANCPVVMHVDRAVTASALQKLQHEIGAHPLPSHGVAMVVPEPRNVIGNFA